MADQTRWTEIELLPDWDEEYYDVYTARKLGKWVMLKTLKPEFRNDPVYVEMMEKEFDVRYNISHPDIVMVNDYEDVPGIGRCIITDDVYGDTLATLIEKGAVTMHHLKQLITRLPAAMEYIQQNHITHRPITPGRIIFTQNVGNLKLIDVGFDRQPRLSHANTNGDIAAYGRILEQVMKSSDLGTPELRRIAERCRPDSSHPFRDVQSLQIALRGRSNNRLYVTIIVFLIAMVAALAWVLTLTPGKLPV